MRRLFAPLVASLFGAILFGAALPAQADGPAEGQIRVGTWNIENLGKRRTPRSDEDMAAMAAFIKELGVDVLALQEINGTAPLHRLMKALGEDYQFVLGTTGTFKTGQIGVGFLWNTKRVKLLQAEELLDLPSKTPGGDWIFHRKPVVGTFKTVATGFDFRAVVVHLKAGRLNTGENWQRNVNKRNAEVEELGKRLEALLAKSGEDQDLLILGDFNHDPSYPSAKALAKRFEYLKPAEKHRSITYFDEQIDHLVISKGLKEEVVPGSLKIWFKRHDADPKAYKARYSDHIPVTVDLDASTDRDPEATFAKPGLNQALEPAGKKAPRPAEEKAPDDSK